MFETPLLQRIKAFKISIASKFPFIQLTDFKELLLWKTIPVPVLCIITGLKVETMYSAKSVGAWYLQNVRINVQLLLLYIYEWHFDVWEPWSLRGFDGRGHF